MNKQVQTVQIVPLLESELPELAALAARTYAATYGPFMSEADLKVTLEKTRSVQYFKHALTQSTILVAKLDGKIVGYVQFGTVLIKEAKAGRNDRELGRLYVDVDQQEKGIGRQLAEVALSEPDMARAPRIFLQVWEQNPRALNLYHSLGFTQFGTTKFTLGDGTPTEDLVLVKVQAR